MRLLSVLVFVACLAFSMRAETPPLNFILPHFAPAP